MLSFTLCTNKVHILFSRSSLDVNECNNTGGRQNQGFTLDIHLMKWNGNKFKCKITFLPGLIKNLKLLLMGVALKSQLLLVLPKKLDDIWVMNIKLYSC